jgi:DNA primase
VNDAAWRYVTSDRLADQARAYLARRGIDTWRLETQYGAPLAGYTPASRTGLTEHLRRLGATADELVDSGWTVRRSDGLCDRFHRRVLLPVRRADGQLAGVIGRDVTDHARHKYLNTARTVAYNKGSLLYRPLELDRRDAVVIVCEGPLDALAIAAAATARDGGVHPVAPSGTALTTEQARIVADLSAGEPVICADADPAGATAAAKWAVTLRAQGTSPRTVMLPASHDPASLLASQGSSGLDLLMIDTAVDTGVSQLDHRPGVTPSLGMPA